MLSYALAIVVAISSLVLFSTAFLMSKIHRRDDFLWSAVGLFYALVLWYCARNITGAVLLGQAAATALLVSYSWQTIKLRRIVVDPTQAAAANNSVLGSINGFWKRKKPRKPQTEVAPTPVEKPAMPTVTEEIAIPETPVETSEVTTATPAKEISDKTSQVANAVNPPQANIPSNTSKNTTVPQADTPDKTPEANSTTDLPRVSEPAIEAKIDAAAPKPLVDIEIIDKATTDSDDRVSQQPIAPTQPLPNKLPEVASTESMPEDKTASVAEINADSESKKLPETTENEPTAALPVKEVKPELAANNSEAKAPKPASPLDSLETVEVAEVLEAQSDREFNNRRGDRSDEIEVTATDVDVAENQTKDRNQQGESDLNDV